METDKRRYASSSLIRLVRFVGPRFATNTQPVHRHSDVLLAQGRYPARG